MNAVLSILLLEIIFEVKRKGILCLIFNTSGFWIWITEHYHHLVGLYLNYRVPSRGESEVGMGQLSRKIGQWVPTIDQTYGASQWLKQ